jgi:hypothetical protein
MKSEKITKDGQTKGQKDRQTDAQTHEQTEAQTNYCMSEKSKVQWAPLNRITLGHEQFDSNNRI